MPERPNPRLKSSGQEIIASPQTARESRGKPIKETAEEDPLQAFSKQENTRGQRQPQTARALLEVNKQIVSKKQEDQALARQRSRERVDKLLQGEQRDIEADKAKGVSRRLAQSELAKYYKSKIAEREDQKANSYKAKVDSGADTLFFPYTEGEKIYNARTVQREEMKQEMQGFLEQQRAEKPGKAGRQMRGDPQLGERIGMTSQTVEIESALFRESLQDGRSACSSRLATPKQPRFLTRPTATMSRRVQDDHVRKALEDKVQRTREELEKLTRERVEEASNWEEGMMVNDALRYDATQSKFSERHKNSEFLKAQMEERKQRDIKETQARRSEITGYWGPEEKECPDLTQHLTHNSDLIKQMEVNQHRKIASRSRRIVQEKSLVQNSIGEIAQDREAERQKAMLHREVLVTTWDSQRKIREVMNRIEAES